MISSPLQYCRTSETLNLLSGNVNHIISRNFEAYWAFTRARDSQIHFGKLTCHCAQAIEAAGDYKPVLGLHGDSPNEITVISSQKGNVRIHSCLFQHTVGDKSYRCHSARVTDNAACGRARSLQSSRAHTKTLSDKIVFHR